MVPQEEEEEAPLSLSLSYTFLPLSFVSCPCVCVKAKELPTHHRPTEGRRGRDVGSPPFLLLPPMSEAFFYPPSSSAPLSTRLPSKPWENGHSRRKRKRRRRGAKGGREGEGRSKEVSQEFLSSFAEEKWEGGRDQKEWRGEG